MREASFGSDVNRVSMFRRGFSPRVQSSFHPVLHVSVYPVYCASHMKHRSLTRVIHCQWATRKNQRWEIEVVPINYMRIWMRIWMRCRVRTSDLSESFFKLFQILVFRIQHHSANFSIRRCNSRDGMVVHHHPSPTGYLAPCGWQVGPDLRMERTEMNGDR